MTPFYRSMYFKWPTWPHAESNYYFYFPVAWNNSKIPRQTNQCQDRSLVCGKQIFIIVAWFRSEIHLNIHSRVIGQYGRDFDGQHPYWIFCGPENWSDWLPAVKKKTKPVFFWCCLLWRILKRRVFFSNRNGNKTETWWNDASGLTSFIVIRTVGGWCVMEAASKRQKETPHRDQSHRFSTFSLFDSLHACRDEVDRIIQKNPPLMASLSPSEDNLPID